MCVPRFFRCLDAAFGQLVLPIEAHSFRKDITPNSKHSNQGYVTPMLLLSNLSVLLFWFVIYKPTFEHHFIARSSNPNCKFSGFSLIALRAWGNALDRLVSTAREIYLRICQEISDVLSMFKTEQSILFGNLNWQILQYGWQSISELSLSVVMDFFEIWRFRQKLR